MVGFNTDVAGVIFAFEEAGISPRGMRMVIVGAGGASRAVIAALAEMGCREISVLNRTVSRSRALAKMTRERYNIHCRGMKLSSEGLRRELGGADLLVNATPLGMHPEIGESPVPADLIREDVTVFDLVYNPPETRLLREARRSGAKILGGAEMLLGQGIASFRLWFDMEPPVEEMRRALLEGLRTRVEG